MRINRLIGVLGFGLWLGCCGALAGTLLPNAEQTFLDQNGDPLGAGRVYFYIPNTMTPKITWKDSAQTVQNTNPVVLDNAGRAIIYGAGVYRQIVKDVFGNTVWDQLTQGLGSGGQLINGVITGNTTIGSCAGVFPIVNATSAPITINVPAGAADGDTCQFEDAGFTAGLDAETISFGSAELTSGETSYVLQNNGQVIGFTWLATQMRWSPN